MTEAKKESTTVTVRNLKREFTQTTLVSVKQIVSPIISKRQRTDSGAKPSGEGSVAQSDRSKLFTVSQSHGQQPPLIIPVLSSSEEPSSKETTLPSVYSFTVRKPRKAFTAGEEMAGLASRLPDLFATGPLQQAGHYSEWFRREGDVVESEADMRDAFEFSLRQFQDRVAEHLRNAQDFKDAMERLTLDQILKEYYGVRPHRSMLSQDRNTDEDN